MSSYSDYIASKRLYVVNNGSSNNSCNAPCIQSAGPLYDGACGVSSGECSQGPTGPPGDTYLSYFTETFYANLLFIHGAVAIRLNEGLAYLPGMSVRCQAVLLPNEYDIQYFYGIVSSYDKENGLMVVNAINRISANFPYGQVRRYSANIDNTGPTGYTGPSGGPTGETGPTGPYGGPPGPQGPPGDSVILQSTVNQTTVNNTIPTSPVVGLANNVILGNSLTFSNAGSGKVLSYANSTNFSGFSINDNVRVNSLFFSASQDKYISYIENTKSNFIVNGAIELSGNVILGNLDENNTGIPLNSIKARLPQIPTTMDSYAVRMVYTDTVYGMNKWQLFASSSSAKYKTNIETLPDSTSILDVRPVSYNPIGSNGELGEKHIGFIAEEMAQNELGDYFVIHDENGVPKSIQYELIIPLYASAMRALRARVADLENTVIIQGEKLAKMDDLEARLQEIEDRMAHMS